MAVRGVNQVDAGIAAVFVAAAVVQAVAVDHDVPGLAAFEVTGALWLSTLALRRQRPLVPICVIAALGVLGSVVTRLVWPDAPDAGGVWILALMLAAYSLGAHASGRVIVLGVLLPMLVVVSTDTTTRDGWARVSGILFVTVFVGLLPTAVGRLVQVRGRRLEVLRAQRARILQEQRAQQRDY